MTLQLRNYDPAIMEGASVDISSSMAQLSDINSNESLILTATTNAVNQLTLINSATGNPVQLNATGDDTNVGISMATKGTGGFILTAATLTGNQLDLVSSALTTGKALDISDLSAITSGKAIHVAATGITQTTGILVHVVSAGTVITGAGRLFLSDHTGVTGTSAILNEFASAANDETVILKVTASDVNALGTAFVVSTATTTGNGITVTANAITSGFGIGVSSSNTTMTSAGRLLSVVHSGNAGVSTIIAEVKSAAADETVVMQVLASAALAAGKVLNLSGAAVTTGTILNMSGLDALTTGTGINLVSNSSDTGTRVLFQITNDNTAATGTTCLSIQNDATAGAHIKLTGTGILGIDFTALGNTDILWDCTAGSGCIAAPQTNAAIGFLNIKVAGTAQWIPYYNAT